MRLGRNDVRLAAVAKSDNFRSMKAATMEQLEAGLRSGIREILREIEAIHRENVKSDVRIRKSEMAAKKNLREIRGHLAHVQRSR